MNKLIFNDVGLWPHALELCELSRSFIDKSHNVFFLSSNDSLIGNPPNPLNSKSASLITTLRNNLIHKELKKFGINCFFIRSKNRSQKNDFNKYISTNILDSIYASYCEILKDGLANRNSKHYLNFERKALTSIRDSIHYLENFVTKYEIDEIVVWNGRRPGQTLLVNIAKKKLIKYSSIIQSQINGKYAYKKSWPHINDIKSFANLIKEKLVNYEKHGFDENLIKMADLYFQRAQGIIKRPTSFSKAGFYTYSEKYFRSETLEKKILHSKLNKKKIVSIFPGTFLEFNGLPGYSDDGIFKSHYEHINFLLSLNLFKSHHFILRFHPNQGFVKFNEQLEINKITKEANKRSNFDVILPSQNISSYEIIKNSDLVIAIGSSISVEALRMGKKVMFLGCHWLQSLESLYKPKTRADIVNFINSEIEHNYKNSFRDSTIFANTFLNDDDKELKYYKRLDKIIASTFLNILLRKIGSFLVLISKYLFELKFLIYYKFNKFYN